MKVRSKGVRNRVEIFNISSRGIGGLVIVGAGDFYIIYSKVYQHWVPNVNSSCPFMSLIN